MAKLFARIFQFLTGAVMNRKFSLIIIIAVILMITTIVLIQMRRSRSKSNLAIDSRSATAEDNSNTISSIKYEKSMSSAEEQEALPTEEELAKALEFLDDLEAADKQAPAQAEAEETESQEAAVISTEHLRIGMILDPYIDIPGAKYKTFSRLGRGTVRLPINIPPGIRPLLNQVVVYHP